MLEYRLVPGSCRPTLLSLPRRSPVRFTLAGLALVTLLPHTATAAWPSDPSVNVGICRAAKDQGNPAIVTDGAGGAIVTWQDYRSGNTDIFAQHLLANGTVDSAWPA